MSFAHASGVAADYAAWFAVFESFITGIGWTVESGSGTTDLIIRSLGEEGAYTMLWAHVRVIGAGIRFDVQDDLAGTHVTTSTAHLTLPVGAFEYWMNGDMEFINVCTRNVGLAWDYAGFGCLWEFALGLPDETYKMVANQDIIAGTILRWHTGAWDGNLQIWNDPNAATLRVHPQDGSLTFMGLFMHFDTEIAGQIPHISGQLTPTVALLTLITTADLGVETAWIVMQDFTTRHFAMRTGGAQPAGVSEGEFGHQEVIADEQVHFIETLLPAFMVARGWTDLGTAGVYTVSRLFYSTGESGADDIYLGVAWDMGVTDWLRIFVQDDAVGTHRTTTVYCLLEEYSWPHQFQLMGDRDCLLIACEPYTTIRYILWGGKLIPGAPGLDCAYHMATYSNYVAGGGPRLLRDCDGNWDQVVNVVQGSAQTQPSSPNDFDGLTSVMWPIWLRDARAAGGSVMVGQFQYLYHINSIYGFTRGDAIPVEDRDYEAIASALGTFFAVRKV